MRNLLNLKQAAAQLGWHVEKLRSYHRRGLGPAYVRVHARKVLIDRDEVILWAQAFERERTPTIAAAIRRLTRLQRSPPVSPRFRRRRPTRDDPFGEKLRGRYHT